MGKDMSLHRTLVLCRMKAGKYEEAQKLLVSTCDSSEEDQTLSYLLGISYLEQEKHEESLNELLKISPESELMEQAKAPLLALLRRKAVQSINEKDWNTASDTLSRAMEIDPDDQMLKQLMKSVQDVVFIVYLKVNKRKKAIETWESKLKEEPNNSRIWHCLALANYWEAKHQHEKGALKASRQPWLNTLMYWGALLADQSFWNNWVQERLAMYEVPVEVVCGTRIEGITSLDRLNNDSVEDWKKRKVQAAITDIAEQVKSVVHSIGAELSTNLKRCQHQNDDEAASLYRDLIIGFARERRTANLLQEIKSQNGTKPSIKDLPNCGPELLARLGLLSKAKKAAQGLKADGDLYEQLWIYLSLNGPILAAIEENMYGEAMALGEERLNTNKKDAEAKKLLGKAYGNYAAERTQHGDFDGALDALRRAKKSGCIDKCAEQVKEVASKLSRHYEKKSNDAEKDAEKKKILQAGIELLRELYDLSSDAADSLAYLLRILAIQVTSKGHYDEGIKLCREGYKKAPKNIKIKQQLANLLANRGVTKSNAGGDGVSDLSEAYILDPDDKHVREQYSAVLCGDGIKKWNSYSQQKGIDLVAQALEINPNNQHAHTQGIKMLSQTANAGLNTQRLATALGVGLGRFGSLFS